MTEAFDGPSGRPEATGYSALACLAMSVASAAALVASRAVLGDWIVLPAAFYVAVAALLMLAYQAGAERRADAAALSFALALGFVLAVCALPLGAVVRLLLIAAPSLWLAMSMQSRPGPGAAMRACLLGVVIAVIVFLTANGKDYATVLVPDTVLMGMAHGDTLYHSAIGAMFAAFGVASTGLDGIPLTHYHTFSNILLGMLAKGADIRVPSGYFLGMQVILLPILYFGLSAATAHATGKRSLLNLVVPLAIMAVVGLRDFNAYFVSESHAFGLALILLGCGVLRSIRPGEPMAWSSLLAIFAIALLATATKVSIGGIYIAGLFAAVVFSRGLRPMQWLALGLFLIAVAAALLAFFLPESHASQSRLAPFSFVLEYPVVALINLVPIAAAVAISLRTLRRDRTAIWPKALILMLGASVVPAMLLHVDGASGYYFLNVGTWLAAVEIGALLVIRFIDRPQRLKVVPVAVLVLCGLYIIQIQQLHARLWDTVVAIHERTRPQGQEAADTSILGRGQAIAAIRPSLPVARLAAAIEAAKVDDRSLVLLTDAAWAQLPFSCQTAPFVVPAYVGLPMLMGLRTVSRDCDFGPHYSFPDYDQSPPAAEDLSETEICAAAIERGFSHVLLARSMDDVADISCATKP